MFLESRAWGLLVEVLQAQIKGREQTVCGTPVRTREAQLEHEWVKGELAMAQLIVRLPEIQIDVLTEALKEITNGTE